MQLPDGVMQLKDIPSCSLFAIVNSAEMGFKVKSTGTYGVEAYLVGHPAEKLTDPAMLVIPLNVTATKKEKSINPFGGAKA